MELSTYNEILAHFVSADPADPDWLREPFMANGKACATEMHALVLLEHQTDLPDLSDKVKSVYPVAHNVSIEYYVQDIRAILSVMDKAEETRTDQTDCDECNGEGEVSWSYMGSRSSHYMDADCPVCNGDGYTHRVKVKTGRMVYDPTEVIEVNEVLFSGQMMERLVWLADKVGATSVRLVRSVPNMAALFIVGECELLIMPVMKAEQLIHTLRPIEVAA